MLSDLNTAQVINEFLTTFDEVFTCDVFCSYLKERGAKISKQYAEEVLHSSENVFVLENNEFITRAGVFCGRCFSFMPTKEEIEKGHFLIGHRCMPFINPEVTPENINVAINNKMVITEPCEFSMNLALDVYAFYGEGYVLPFIFNDSANDVPLIESVQYQMPQNIKLTSWPLKPFEKNGQKVEYGDRILCRVISWDETLVEMELVKNDAKDFVVSAAAIQRQQWYSDFENGLLESFDKNGPASSIEEQLALLFLENQEQLCIKNCGSCEEFLKHTRKIGFSPFGVESRIWRIGEKVPYIGEWNKNFEKEIIMSDLSLTFSPQVIDAYLEDNIYREQKHEETDDLSDLIRKIFPTTLKISIEERKTLLLNIEKRNDILKKGYNKFGDYPIAPLRKRILALFTEVNALLCDIGCSGLSMEGFPQQEMVILTQLFSHMVRLLEEIENSFMRENFPVGDVNLSLDGMEDTFEGISGMLYTALKVNRSKGFELVK